MPLAWLGIICLNSHKEFVVNRRRLGPTIVGFGIISNDCFYMFEIPYIILYVCCILVNDPAYFYFIDLI